jgi:catechol 2,3-dioxygenase-like lactoylglutathione lyase family enzyme
MIGAIDHVRLRVADLDEAAQRWARQFGLTEREREPGRVALSCDDEPKSLELVPGEPGFEHVGYRLRRDCSLEDAAARLAAHGVEYTEVDGELELRDPEGHKLRLVPYRRQEWVPHARPADSQPVGHPRKLGHVNFLTADIEGQVAFYTEVLGMRITDWLGDDGVWLYVNSDHHVHAFINKGYAHLHHLAFEVVDIGQMRAALDHLGRHGRWVAWGPTRHGVGGNIASYVRITEEPLFVELYCDMEQLEPDHEARRWPDNRFSSNTWGSLPPRSYFRFDEKAIESERESAELLVGVPA